MPARSWFEPITLGALPGRAAARPGDVAYILEQSDSSTLMLAERSGPVDYLAMIRGLVPMDGAGGTSRLPKLQRLVVEAYLMSHPAINLAAVVSYPDRERCRRAASRLQ